MRRPGALAFLVASISLGCGPSGPLHGTVPVPIDVSSPEYAPFAKAIAAVDRTGKGFSSIDPKAAVYVEGEGEGYDAMLHFYSPDDPKAGYRKVERTVGFRKTATGYRWCCEQEVHNGPRTYSTDDGEERESIDITYDTEPTFGAPVGVTAVHYLGEDERLAWPKEPTLKDVRPVLREWK